MEALILSCSTGGGHNAAGKAIAEELESRGHRVTFLDPYQLVGKKTANHVGNLYIRVVQRSPRLFGWLYSLGESYRRLPVHSPVYWVNGKVAAVMQRYLQGRPFDCILMTHMYPAHILAHIDQAQEKLPTTVLVATDYTCIPFMEESNCDYYVIPAPDLKEEFCSRGLPDGKILPYGIPVRKGFSIPCSKGQACAALGLEPGKRYILLAGGSIGAGQITDAIRCLLPFLHENREYQLLVLCGKNGRLYERLRKFCAGQERVSILGNTDRMPEYLKACDIFISKPGGLSSTEAAVCGTPLVHISPIPGCEECNAAYFSRNGMSIFVPDMEGLVPALLALQKAPQRARMRQAQQRGIDRQAAGKLCDFLERTVGR